MRRRLFTIVSAVSLMLCVASGAFWIRSYWWTEVATGSICNQGVALGVHDWHLYLIYLAGMRTQFYIQRGPAAEPTSLEMEAADHQLLGFGCGTRGRHMWMIYLPLWFTMLLSGAAAFYFHRRRRMPYASGLCRTCGYNLRGNFSGICPECGSPVLAKEFTT